MSGNFDKAIEAAFNVLISDSVGKQPNVHLLEVKDTVTIQDPVTKEVLNFTITRIEHAHPRKGMLVRDIPIVIGFPNQASKKWVDTAGKFLQSGLEYVITSPPIGKRGSPLIDVTNYKTPETRLQFINSLLSMPPVAATAATKPGEEDERTKSKKGVGGWIRNQLYNISDPAKLSTGKDILSRAVGGAYTGAVQAAADVIGKEKTAGDPYAWSTSKFRKSP